MDPFHKLTQMKTLLVDDDPLIRDALHMAFMNKGCFLQVAQTAEEGLQALEKENFDIIISDFRLPGVDGLEFFKQVVASYPNTVNVLISAYGDVDPVSRAFDIGVHGFIEKPFSIMKLVDSLNQQIEKRNGKKSTRAEVKTKAKKKTAKKPNTSTKAKR